MKETDKIKSTDSLKVEIIHLATGRKVIHSNDDETTDVEKIEEMIIGFVNSRNKNQLTDFITARLSCVKTYFNITQCFKGVKTDTAIKGNYIGPSPKWKAKDNRYSTLKERALYLSLNKDAIKLELDTKEIQIQEYLIDCSNYKIADLINTPDNTLKCLFSMAELGRTFSGFNIEDSLIRSNQSKYEFSQLLASVFKIKGYHGMIVPGVRGNEKFHYMNLVCFSSMIEHWRKWRKGYFYKY